MEFKVLSVLKKYMTEEQFTAFEKAAEFEDAIGKDISKYIKSNTPTVEDVKSEVLSNLIKEIGVEGSTINDVKTHMENLGNTTKDYDDLKQKYDAEVANRTKLENERKEQERIDLIKGLGITDNEQVEYLKWKFEKSVTEEKDFATVVEDYKKENDITTTTKFIKDDFGNFGSTKDLDIGEALKKQIRKK